MKEPDLQKVGLMVCALVFFLASKLPDAALCLVILWAGALAFDGIENRNPMRRAGE